MNELVIVKRNVPFTDSLKIAEGTQNQHLSVVRLVKRHRKIFERWGKVEFMDFKSINSKRGRPQKIALLNEQQAIYLLTLLDNNEIILQFKAELVDQFCKMREQLQERKTPEWKETREFGKKIRRKFTDTIQRYIELAKAQGHDGSARFAYSNFSKLVEKPFGKRDLADGEQLVLISATEHILDKTISPMVDAGVDAKEIYGVCKERAKNTVCMLTA